MVYNGTDDNCCAICILAKRSVPVICCILLPVELPLFLVVPTLLLLLILLFLVCKDEVEYNTFENAFAARSKVWICVGMLFVNKSFCTLYSCRNNCISLVSCCIFSNNTVRSCILVCIKFIILVRSSIESIFNPCDAKNCFTISLSLVVSLLLLLRPSIVVVVVDISPP